MANDVRLILPVVLLLAGCVGTLRIPAPETAPRLKVLWSLDLHREIPVNKLYGKQEFSSPVLADRRLVVATSTGEVHDLNPFNPSDRRILPVKSDSLLSAPLFLPDKEDLLILADLDGTLQALAWPTGKLRWTKPLGGSVLQTPAYDGELLYLLDTSHTLTAVTVNNGEVRWTQRHEPERAQDLLSAISPVVHQDALFIGQADGVLQCLERLDGKERWRRVLEPLGEGQRLIGFAAPVQVFDNLLIAATYSSALYGLSSETGDTMWRRVDIPGIVAMTASSEGILYIGASDGSFHALDRDTGASHWTLNSSAFEARAGELPSPALVLGEYLVLGYTQSDLFLLRRSDGALLDRLALGSGLCSSPTLGPEGTFFVLSNLGVLYQLSLVQ